MKTNNHRISISVLVLCFFMAVTSLTGCNQASPETMKTEILYNGLKAAKDVSTQKELMLVKDNQSSYKIVYPAGGSSIELYAATYLRDILNNSSNANIQCVTDSSINSFAHSDYYISIGNTKPFTQSGITLNNSLLGDDGFVISLKGNSIFINGGGYMGILYGVMEFLKYEIDYEVYATDEIYYNKIGNIKMLDFGTKEFIPDFAYRSPGDYIISDVNESALYRTYHAKSGGATMEGSSWSSDLQYHTIKKIVSTTTYPQWYSNGQLCLTNNDAIEFVGEKVADIIKNSPSSQIYFELGNADTPTSCGCSDCINSAQENGGIGGVYIIWLNKVAEKILEIFEDENIDRQFYLVALAYNAYSNPPTILDESTGTYVPVNENVICNEHVAVRYCPINACYAHPMNDSDCEINSQAGMEAAFRGWAAITEKSRLLLYLYGTDFNDYFFFYNDFGSLSENAKFYKEIGVYGIYDQMTSNSNAPFAALRVFLRSKLWWDTSYNTEKLIEDFFRNYYKEASEYMMEYFNAIRAQFVRISVNINSKGCQGYNKIGGDYLTALNWPYELLVNYSDIISNAYSSIEAANYSPEEYEKMRLRISADEMFVKNLYIKYYSVNFSSESWLQLRNSFISDNIILGNTNMAEGKPLVLN